MDGRGRHNIVSILQLKTIFKVFCDVQRALDKGRPHRRKRWPSVRKQREPGKLRASAVTVISWPGAGCVRMCVHVCAGVRWGKWAGFWLASLNNFSRLWDFGSPRQLSGAWPPSPGGDYGREIEAWKVRTQQWRWQAKGRWLAGLHLKDTLLGKL